MNSFKTIFKSAEFTQQFLKNKYEKSHVENSSEQAYRNSYSFLYYIEMGNHFFNEGETAPFAIQPVLLFYGLSHWLKAALLTIDPDYPRNSQVLAHGLSTRKRKKQSYKFLQDEVRIQKHGLFPYLSEKLFNVKQVTGEKRSMRQLLFCLPEMQAILQTLMHEKGLVRLTKVSNGNYSLLKTDLNEWNGPTNSWLRQLSNDISGQISPEESNDFLHLSFTPPRLNEALIFRWGRDKQLYAPITQSFIINLPELLIHYTLLYQLSMICRYEVEWWGELLYSFSTNDYPIISEFLLLTKKKCPFLLENLFFDF